MNFGVLGTGIVGRTVGGKLVALGHEVMIGTRDVARTMAVTQPDRMGSPPLSAWLKEHPKMRLGTFAQAAAHGEILVNATAGTGSLEALRQAGETNLNGKVLIDISNPLDFSRGMPPDAHRLQHRLGGRADPARLPGGEGRQDAEYGDRESDGGTRPGRRR